MKKLIIAAALFLAPAAAHAGAYGGVGVLFHSVSLDTPYKGGLPSDLKGYGVDAGYRWHSISAGVEYTSAQASQNGGNLAANRYGLTAAYHFTVIPSVDTYLGAGVGRTTYHADLSTFTAGTVKVTRLFGGTQTDWNVGGGLVGPLYGPLKWRATGSFQPSSFGGHASSIVLGLGLVLAQ